MDNEVYITKNWCKQLQTHFTVEMVSRIFNLIINTFVHHHHRTGMPKPFCCGKPLDVLNGFQHLYFKTI